MKQCTVRGCSLPARGRGYCNPHYHRVRRTGDPGTSPVGLRPDRRAHQRGSCQAEGCERPHRAGGLCHAHYERKRVTGEAGPLRGRVGDASVKMCSIEDCPSPAIGRGWCSLHWQRWKKHGDPLKLVRDGTGWLNGDGYRVVYRDGRDRLEHHVVMELVLGRPLKSHEEVHHRNTRRADNQPENLELWAIPQPAGARVEDLVAWVIQEYPDLVAEALSSA